MDNRDEIELRRFKREVTVHNAGAVSFSEEGILKQKVKCFEIKEPMSRATLAYYPFFTDEAIAEANAHLHKVLRTF
jgi:hypothetical protein